MGYPTVKADRAFSVTFDSHHMSIAEGQVLEGELARYLADTGTPVTVLDDGAELEVDKPVEKMTAKELKAYAEANHIDLGGASKKADILAVITAAAGPVPDEDDDLDVDASDDADGTDPDGAAGESD
jgi:hypothetical protein